MRNRGEDMPIKSLIAAFAMYSRVPMPKVELNEDDMRYIFCFFPFIGVVIAAAVYFLDKVLKIIGVGNVLYGAVMTLIPVIVTGGIHCDGLLDTFDALGSYGDKEKRLEIMKDPNCGAFAVMGGIGYFALSMGLWCEGMGNNIFLVCMGYFISRSLSGLSVLSFPLAKDTGLAATFRKGASRKISVTVCIIGIIAEFGLMMYFDMAGGMAVMIVSLICFAVHYVNCMKNFGGISGDLSGAFLQVCELAVLMAAEFVK